MTERILYQFPISHYCEKSRWQLDHKGLAYRTRNLLPGPHRLRTQWMARINTLPVLRDGQRVVGDSTKIAYYLEKHYPERSLIPTDAESRARVIELEQQLDRVAVHVRRWLYGQIIDRPEVMDAMLDPYRLPSPVQKVLAPVTRATHPGGHHRRRPAGAAGQPGRYALGHVRRGLAAGGAAKAAR